MAQKKGQPQPEAETSSEIRITYQKQLVEAQKDVARRFRRATAETLRALVDA